MSKLLLFAVVSITFFTLPSDAQEAPGDEPQTRKAPNRLVDGTFMQMEQVGSPAISPDGSQIIFTRTWVDLMSDQRRSNLWLTDFEGKRVRELTHGNFRDTNPIWSPDGSQIAFISDRDGTSQLHVMWMDTREVAQLTRLERAPANIKWSPDGTQLVFTQFVPSKNLPLNITLPQRPAGARWAEGAILVDRMSWQRDGSGYQPTGSVHAFTLDARLGGTPRQITFGDYDHSSPEWTRDGKRILISAIRKPDAEYLKGDSEIYSINLGTLEITTLTDRNGPDGNPTVSPDGNWIAYAGYDQQNFTLHLASIYLMDSAGAQKRLLAGDLPSSPTGMTWAEDSSGLYFEVEKHGSRNLHFVPLDGGVSDITSGVHMLFSNSISQNGRVAAVRSNFHQPGDLVAYNLSSPQEIRSLVDVNTDVLTGVELGEVEELWYKSADGLDVQGWLIKPVGFDPEKKYPMVLWIHGGPWSMYSVGFNWSFQNFAAEGYAVLYTNPRGSTGYGQEFVNGIQYSYPGRDYDDLMAGVDAAIAKGWIDAENLFVCGGSGGGVLTAWIVGHTDRFRAAVSMRPVINWHSFVGTTDGVSWYDQFRRFPWEDPLEFAARSPLNYVQRVTTPTMVMTGEADLRTPMTQSEEYYRALKLLKKETLLIRMPEEYHGWRRPSRQLAQQLYLRAWFEKWRKQTETADTGKREENK
ncbi:MAG TPA: S9 family peptidase [Pirellulaceae bacterium]|nr:S9 family peptidase [Pirellulaceae bacterium]HMO90984.1 S9 family peptidase [Pirellulaceae bacterium]HMP68099.1 S9 family peptidase [Pirellulaceae bacterium]